MTLRQLPDFAFRSVTDYRDAMAEIHARYDAVLGVAVVDLLEQLQLFQVFRSTWFTLGLIVLILSIIVCTLDRLPGLWRQGADVRVVQPAPFYDPKLPERAQVAGVDAAIVARTLRARRFAVREVEHEGRRYVYGDRNRWTKLATLSTHLGLILFLVAAAVTWKLGDEQGLVVAEGESLTVQPIGTPGLLLVRNHRFDAPGFLEGRATDFVTDLSVYRDGTEIARREVRVNEPLAVAGYTFHQNGFGPAPDVIVRDREGQALWSGPIPMTDALDGIPAAQLNVPGRETLLLQFALERRADGVGVLLVLPFEIVGADADGSPLVQPLRPFALTLGASAAVTGTDVGVELRAFSDYTLLIAKRDPGQGVAWLAFGCLIVGLMITFWMPRRRVWARIEPDGRASFAWRADRYVDGMGEFGRILDDVVAARRAAPG